MSDIYEHVLLECLLWYLIFNKNYQQSCLISPNEILGKLVTVKQVVFNESRFLLETERCMTFSEKTYFKVTYFMVAYFKVFLRTKKHLHHHYRLHLITELSWKCFKRSFRLPFFCSGTSKLSISQGKTTLSSSIKVSIPGTYVLTFSTIIVVDVAGWCFWPPV